MPIDAIQEFNTTQNPKAEYGWRDGSIVNVGIKSGTNSLHGTAYAFGRDASATDARTPSHLAATPATLEQFGALRGTHSQGQALLVCELRRSACQPGKHVRHRPGRR